MTDWVPIRNRQSYQELQQHYYIHLIHRKTKRNILRSQHPSNARRHQMMRKWCYLTGNKNSNKKYTSKAVVPMRRSHHQIPVPHEGHQRMTNLGVSHNLLRWSSGSQSSVHLVPAVQDLKAQRQNLWHMYFNTAFAPHEGVLIKMSRADSEHEMGECQHRNKSCQFNQDVQKQRFVHTCKRSSASWPASGVT